jgi:YbbR domain-containing protein
MDRIMDNPWFLRFTALFLAVILFYSVQTEEGEPNGGKVGDHLDMIRDVPVQVYYDNENLVVTGVPETVNITIEGPINLVQTTKMLKDFSLIVDLRTLTMGRHQVSIQSENISEKLDVRIDPAMVNVLIEEKITETFKVEPEFNKRLLAEDFQVANIDVVPSTIEVTGAKSIIESISFVKATVVGENGIRESFEQQAKIRVLDRDLNKLDVSIVPETVTVKVEVV